MQIIIDGPAVPQGRPRAVRAGSGVRMYDPPKSRNYKEVVRLKCKSYMSRNQIKTVTGPLALHLTFYFKPPKSYSKKRIEAIKSREELFTKKPDLDNLAKSILDGMSGTVFVDDAQIVYMSLQKEYADRDYVIAEITEAK